MQSQRKGSPVPHGKHPTEDPTLRGGEERRRKGGGAREEARRRVACSARPLRGGRPGSLALSDEQMEDLSSSATSRQSRSVISTWCFRIGN